MLEQLGWDQRRHNVYLVLHREGIIMGIDQLKYPSDGELNSKEAINVHGLAYGYPHGNSKMENTIMATEKYKIRVLMENFPFSGLRPHLE